MDNLATVTGAPPIYLDYAATTPIDNRVFEKMLPYMAGEIDSIFGNPASSTHSYGWQAKEAVSNSRALIAQLLNVSHKEIIFTSGATESNNLAISGIAKAYKKKGSHIITSATEHKSVLDTCHNLETKGYEVSYIKPQSNGLIKLDDIKQSIRPETILMSVMHVNNETGVIQDIASIGSLAKQHNIIFHVDAAQSMGKLSLDLNKLNIDLLSISGHKIYGPKGIGALFVRRKPHKIDLVPQMHGGGHEYGWRSGTLATHQIVGLAHALQFSLEDLSMETTKLKKFEQRLWQELNKLGGIYLNGEADSNHRKPGHINISVEGIHGDALIASLKNIAVSSGSACNSAVSDTSYVLKAMGVAEPLAKSALRISMGRYTTEKNVEATISHLMTVVNKLRAVAC
ncbi:MAG: aminotransferase class V-fold PLP-dependent enzyme [Gammaproteobacteria bacterium]|nr:aminotransferase class V-fold PLP-dependent enzyme [Gammaproteobacteria bacterium]